MFFAKCCYKDFVFLHTTRIFIDLLFQSIFFITYTVLLLFLHLSGVNAHFCGCFLLIMHGFTSPVVKGRLKNVHIEIAAICDIFRQNVSRETLLRLIKTSYLYYFGRSDWPFVYSRMFYIFFNLKRCS